MISGSWDWAASSSALGMGSLLDCSFPFPLHPFRVLSLSLINSSKKKSYMTFYVDAVTHLTKLNTSSCFKHPPTQESMNKHFLEMKGINHVIRGLELPIPTP